MCHEVSAAQKRITFSFLTLSSLFLALALMPPLCTAGDADIAAAVRGEALEEELLFPLVQSAAIPVIQSQLNTIMARSSTSITGNCAIVLQIGQENFAQITQFGQGNIAAITQIGNNNSATVSQNGTGDQANISLIGNNHSIALTQSGSGLSASVVSH
jgi:hypothetical protein